MLLKDGNRMNTGFLDDSGDRHDELKENVAESNLQVQNSRTLGVPDPASPSNANGLRKS